MPTDQAHHFYSLVFLAALLFSEGAYLLVRAYRRDAEQAANRRRRLRSPGREGRGDEVTLRREQGRKAAWMIGPLPALDRLVAESGLPISTGRTIAAMATLAILVWIALAYAAGAVMLTVVPLAILLGAGVPTLSLIAAKRRRLKRFAEQLPDALEIMVRSLRAGHPITSAFGLVAAEMADPIGAEFEVLVDELTYGFELAEALERLRRRVDHPDLRFMVVTITIQHGAGGNLAEVLANLSTVIRDRYRLYKKVDALSAEGRLSGVVLGLLPVAVIIIMYALNPSARHFMVTDIDPGLILIAGIAMIWYLLSIFAIYKIIKIRI